MNDSILDMEREKESLGEIAMKKTIVFVDSQKLEGAHLLYLLGIARKINMAEFNVDLIGINFSNNSINEWSENGINLIEFDGGGRVPKNRNDFKKCLKASRRRILDYLQQKKGLCRIILLENDVRTLRLLSKYAKSNNINCSFLAFEWPTFDVMKKGSLKTKYFRFTKYLRRRYAFNFGKKVKSVICISKALYKYFELKGCKCLYMPHVLEICENHEYIGNEINLMYNGYPGAHCTKDRLDVIIRGLQYVRNKDKVHLHIYGPTMDKLISDGCVSAEDIEQVREQLIFHGEIKSYEFTKVYEQMDFTVLIRDYTNKSKFGYPTKIAQSCAGGVPAICNITSDLGDMVIDEVTGIVVEDNTSENFAKAVDKIWELDSQTRKKMIQNCIQTAKRIYGIDARMEELIEFLNDDGKN